MVRSSLRVTLLLAGLVAAAFCVTPVSARGSLKGWNSGSGSWSDEEDTKHGRRYLQMGKGKGKGGNSTIASKSMMGSKGGNSTKGKGSNSTTGSKSKMGSSDSRPTTMTMSPSFSPTVTPGNPTFSPTTVAPGSPTKKPTTVAPGTPTNIPSTVAPGSPTKRPNTVAPGTPTKAPSTVVPGTPTKAPTTVAPGSPTLPPTSAAPTPTLAPGTTAAPSTAKPTLTPGTTAAPATTRSFSLPENVNLKTASEEITADATARSLPVASKLAFQFFQGTGRQPTDEEINALKESTRVFFEKEFQNDPAFGPVFQSFEMVPDDTYSEYASTSPDSFTLEFLAKVLVAVDAPAEINGQAALHIMSTSNYQDYITTYLREPGSFSEFYQTNAVKFTGVSHAAN